MLAAARDPEQFAQIAQLPGVAEAVEMFVGPGMLSFGNQSVIAAAAMGAAEAMKLAAGPEQTASFRALQERAAAAGLREGTPEYQQFMASGGRGSETVFGPDGMPIFQRGGFTLPSQTAPAAAGDVSGSSQFQNAPDAFGAGSVLRGATNKVADIISGRVPFPATLEAQNDFAVFGEGLINAFASAYGRQPPSWLLRNIEQLTPRPGNIFEGPQQAQSKLRAIARELETRRTGLVRASQAVASPNAAADAAQQILGIDATLEQVYQALSGFNEGANTGRTSGGIQWSIEE